MYDLRRKQYEKRIFYYSQNRTDLFGCKKIFAAAKEKDRALRQHRTIHG